MPWLTLPAIVGAAFALPAVSASPRGVIARAVKPTLSPSGQRVHAERIADLVKLFGVNPFSSTDQNNVWGSWPADYWTETVIAALNGITGDSGFALRIRKYHNAGREPFQQSWLQQIVAAIPPCGSPCTSCGYVLRTATRTGHGASCAGLVVATDEKHLTARSPGEMLTRVGCHLILPT